MAIEAATIAAVRVGEAMVVGMVVEEQEQGEHEQRNKSKGNATRARAT